VNNISTPPEIGNIAVDTLQFRSFHKAQRYGLSTGESRVFTTVLLLIFLRGTLEFFALSCSVIQGKVTFLEGIAVYY
jgi:hypothetical protein